MLKKSTNYINLISIVVLIYIAFYVIMPKNVKITDTVENNFSIQSAMYHVERISQQPHYVSSNNHQRVQEYIINELKKLDLKVFIQKRNISNTKKTFVKAENIIAKIKGSDSTRKSLVLMSHYDSVSYASPGASDAASGVAVILEGIRAFKKLDITPKNDIIILFTDAEEIGLLGAKAFVNKHQWAENVGAVLNFEARGSSGSSYMLMETQGGNHNLLKSFKQANVNFPSSNSLAYSIYKMLPNDTDLTIFRKDKDIVGFNFAFIDDHFNYHTQLDNSQNLSLDTLSHQAQYLMPMLKKLSQDDLSLLKSEEDDVYFQLPYFKTISYPFKSTILLSVLNLIFLIIVILIGLKNKTINHKKMLLGITPLLKAITITTLVSFVLLKFLYWLHPHYSEILQGFTYNGYWYIALFALVTIAITVIFYQNASKKYNANELMIMPILVWAIISFIAALHLTGAHFFILVSFAGTLSLLANVISKKHQPSFTLLMFAPIIIIFAPFVMQLPVALGLVLLPFSGIILVLIISVFISTIQIPENYNINKWLVLAGILSLYVIAETKASFSATRPIPDSLYYYQDHDSQTAYWVSNDNRLDDWNKKYFENDALTVKEVGNFKTKHWYWSKHVAKTKNRNIAIADIKVVNNRKYQDKHIYHIKITPKRKLSVMYLINNKEVNLIKLSVNNEPMISQTRKIKAKRTMARIYANNELSFDVKIEINPDENLDLSLTELSPNLLNHYDFKLDKRPAEFIPKPYIHSDTIITRQKIKF